MRIAILLLLATSVYAQLPDPTDPGNQNTNAPSAGTNAYVQAVEHGAIITASMTTNVIEWWNFENHVFTVQHRVALTDGGWTNVGEGYNVYEHNNPAGFYRVIESPWDAVHVIWNSGPTNMLWTASSASEWVTVECYNTNLIPEWGAGYVITRVDPACPKGEIMLEATTIGLATNQTMQFTVKVK